MVRLDRRLWDAAFAIIAWDLKSHRARRTPPYASVGNRRLARLDYFWGLSLFWSLISVAGPILMVAPKRL
jgi:hypothetical protein